MKTLGASRHSLGLHSTLKLLRLELMRQKENFKNEQKNTVKPQTQAQRNWEKPLRLNETPPTPSPKDRGEQCTREILKYLRNETQLKRGLLSGQVGAGRDQK